MTFWTPETLRTSCSGTWHLRPSAQTRSLAGGLSTDSRSIQPGQVFLALRGERFDGHQFLAEVAKAGSPLLIVDRPEAVPPLPEGCAVIRVPDTGKALLRLAAAYRKTLDGTKVIAVGGSNGKTTTTRLIHAVLSSVFRGTASAKSFNNAIGVPLTILSAAPNDHYLLCEVGTNAPGEIAQLASVIEPDIAVITSIGREHLEGFGSLAGVAQEEGSLIRYVRTGGLAVVTADTPVEASLAEYVKGAPNLVTFGFSPSADLRASEVEHRITEDGLGVRFLINGRTSCMLPLLGEHNASNALAAFAVGRRLGMEAEKIIEALGRARGPEMRLEPVRVPCGGQGAVTVVNDAYNANPESMHAALNAFEDVCDGLGAGDKGAQRVVVLGDMLELGDQTAASHQEIVFRVASWKSRPCPWSRVVLVGPLMGAAAGQLERTGQVDAPLLRYPELTGEAIRELAGMMEPGSVVLLKGSRRMRLERVLVGIKDRWRVSVSTGMVGKAGCAG